MTSLSLTESQLNASKHFLGPALTLAIPGSGKTTLLLHRLIELVNNCGVKPEQILTLTFSKASAEDMKQRYDEKFANEYAYKFKFMTIHKFAYDIYKSYLKHMGKSMRLIDDGGLKFQILNDIFKKINHEILTEDNYESLSNHIGLIYNLKLQRGDEENFDFQWKNIFDLAEAYHVYKTDHNLFDFDDMLLSAIKILKHSPKVLNHYRKTYRFIQVDEAQDTSKLQFELIEMLLGTEKNLFLVADDDQSIYGFRGAYPKYLLDFSKRFTGAKLYYISENFRSDAQLVQTAMEVISENKTRFDKPMRSTKPAIHAPTVRVFDDLYNRNNYLLNAISNSKLNDTQATHAVHAAHAVHVAILYRNKVSSLSIVDFLDRNHLSFQIKDTPIREFKHWMLEDLMAFFTLILVPQDLQSFNRIAFKMNGFISREMLNYVAKNNRGKNIFTTLVEIPFLMDYQTRTQERLQGQFEALQRLRPYDAIHYIETELGYLDYIKQNTQRLGMTMSYARTRLDAYKAIAKPLKTGFDFINRINELKALLSENTYHQNESITLSTIHGAKGLEFDEVYMIDVNQNVFPGYKATEKNALEEERRLFYVGLTRSKSIFELLHVEFISGSYNPYSIFIEELLSKELTHSRFNNATGKSAIG